MRAKQGAEKLIADMKHQWSTQWKAGRQHGRYYKHDGFEPKGRPRSYFLPEASRTWRARARKRCCRHRRRTLRLRRNSKIPWVPSMIPWKQWCCERATRWSQSSIWVDQSDRTSSQWSSRVPKYWSWCFAGQKSKWKEKYRVQKSIQSPLLHKFSY